MTTRYSVLLRRILTDVKKLQFFSSVQFSLPGLAWCRVHAFFKTRDSNLCYPCSCRWNRKVFRSRRNEERDGAAAEVILGGNAFHARVLWLEIRGHQVWTSVWQEPWRRYWRPKLRLLTPGIAKLQTGRLMDKASCGHCQLTSYIFPQLLRLKLT